MSDIQTYLRQILDAVYGEEVRNSIHDAISTMNSDLESAIQDDLNPLAFKGDLGESGGTNNNLNNLVQTDQRGIWRLKGSTTYTNVPSDFDNGKQGYVIMYAFGTSGQTATVAKQEIHYFSDSGANANIYWSRVYISGEWQPWHKNVDNTLSIEGAAADAAATGSGINSLNGSLRSENLYDVTDITINQYQKADGSYVNYAGLFQTGYIPVTEGKRYISPLKKTAVLWFDSNKAIIGETSSPNYTDYAEAIDGASYAKFIGRLDNVSDFYVCELPSDGESVTEDSIADRIGSYAETENLEPQNLFDINADNMIGEYYSGNDGTTVITNPIFGMTCPIECGTMHLYKTNGVNCFGVAYNASMHYIKRFETNSTVMYNGEAYFCLPSNTAYFRLVFTLDKIHSLYIYDVTDKDHYSLPLDRNALVSNKNLFEITPNVMFGRYYNSSDGHTIVVNSALGVTDYIPVSAGMRYTSPLRNVFVNWYRYDKAFVSFTDSNVFNTNGYVEAPTGASYARFIFAVADVNDFYVYNLSSKEPIVDQKYLPVDVDQGQIINYLYDGFKGKKWVSFGDSITFRNTWQPVIAKLLGLEHTNCGIGSTALSGPYVSGRTDLPSFWMPIRINAVTSADPDLVTILGGANDIAQSGLTLGSDSEFEYALPSDVEASQGASLYSSVSSYSIGSYCTYNSTRYQCLTNISGEEWNSSHWRAVKNVDTFIGAYSYIIETLLTWKRTLSIVILGTTWASNDGRGRSHGITYTMLAEASEKVAKYYGLPFVDLHSLLGYNKYTMGSGVNAIYSDDQLHPNSFGSTQFSKAVLSTFINYVTLH